MKTTHTSVRARPHMHTRQSLSLSLSLSPSLPLSLSTCQMKGRNTVSKPSPFPAVFTGVFFRSGVTISTFSEYKCFSPFLNGMQPLLRASSAARFWILSILAGCLCRRLYRVCRRQGRSETLCVPPASLVEFGTLVAAQCFLVFIAASSMDLCFDGSPVSHVEWVKKTKKASENS